MAVVKQPPLICPSAGRPSWSSVHPLEQLSPWRGLEGEGIEQGRTWEAMRRMEQEEGWVRPGDAAEAVLAPLHHCPGMSVGLGYKSCSVWWGLLLCRYA